MKILCVLLATVFLTVFVGCNHNELYHFSSYQYFNTLTQWVFTTQSDGKDNDTWKQISETLARVEESVSVNKAESSISKFNAARAGEKVELDETAYRLLLLAKEIYEKTDGAYNPAVGNLIDLWGFSPRFSESDYAPVYPYDREKPNEELPQEEYIEAFRKLTDYSEVSLFREEGKFYARKPELSVEIGGVTYTMALNLGGIGKGYAADEANAVIRNAGYEYGYFNLGGSSMSVLKNPSDGAENHTWNVGVVNPRADFYAGSDFMSVNGADISLSSSGDYAQYYTLGERRYCHIMNPRTGYPVNAAPTEEKGGVICASVFGLSAAEGDATTTALIVMGKDRAIEYIQTKLNLVRALFVYDRGDGIYTVYTNMDEGDYTLNAQTEIIKI